MDLDSIKLTFFQECNDQLAEVEDAFMTLQSDPSQVDCVHAIFRAVHSIKGGAGAFGFTELVGFAHKVENALDVIRNLEDPGSDERLGLIATASDHLADAIAATRDETEFPDVSEIIGRLEEAFAAEGLATEEEEDIEFDAVPIELAPIDFGADDEAGTSYSITIKPTLAYYERGNDIQKLVRTLSELGSVEVHADLSDVPPLAAFDGKSVYSTFEITLTSETPADEIEDVLEWCEGDCEVEMKTASQDDSGDDFDLDNLLGNLENVDIGSEGEEADSEDGPAESEEPAAEVAEAPSLAPEAEALNTPPAKAAPKEKPEASEAKAASAPKVSATMRVESDKVDRLINLMGEAVISQAMLAQQLDIAKDDRGSPAVSLMHDIERLMREIQESVMAIRAQPVRPVFMRMSRIIREASNTVGKKANLELEGEGTEVDTTVIEGLSDPLTHMIRNAIDHGIESPEKRIAAGKPEHGTITLAASHQSGRIVVTVSDDGAGVNRERVLAKAIERGIVEEGAELSENEIDNLVFAPGFSTAETITDLSGRGVGMDVVRQSIHRLGGRVTLVSTPGQGTKVRLSLPLTLAILDGMVVTISGEVFVVPMSSVIETLCIKNKDVSAIGGSKVIRVRENLIPIVDVSQKLGFGNTEKDDHQYTLLVVEAQSGRQAAFMVDQFEGQQQIVIKSLETNFHRVNNVSAATILGTGRIALILDVDEIVDALTESRLSAPQNSKLERTAA